PPRCTLVAYPPLFRSRLRRRRPARGRARRPPRRRSLRARGGLARGPERRRGRGAALPRPSRVLGPVPPRGGRRTARRLAPLRSSGRARDRPSRRLRVRAARMPRRPALSSVLVIGSGPIVIGQAAEFDYSGTQACRVLREEGLRVILVNSNPATIMTDPEIADATYIEPIDP